jgi:hypothetical protein
VLERRGNETKRRVQGTRLSDVLVGQGQEGQATKRKGRDCGGLLDEGTRRTAEAKRPLGEGTRRTAEAKRPFDEGTRRRPRLRGL